VFITHIRTRWILQSESICFPTYPPVSLAFPGPLAQPTFYLRLNGLQVVRRVGSGTGQGHHWDNATAAPYVASVTSGLKPITIANCPKSLTPPCYFPSPCFPTIHPVHVRRHFVLFSFDQVEPSILHYIRPAELTTEVKPVPALSEGECIPGAQLGWRLRALDYRPPTWRTHSVLPKILLKGC